MCKPRYYFIKNQIRHLIIVFIFSCSISAIKTFAGDTIFTKPPDTRYWNPDYVQTVFIDNFNGTRLDSSTWAVDFCKSRGYSGNNEGGKNNIEVSNGTLKLWARYEPANMDTNCWENTHFVSDYTTAEISTYMHRYKYGCFEARCRAPRGDHFYYAYWLWGPGGNGYPDDGFSSEIDIIEGVEWGDGTNHEMKSAVHYWSHTSGEISLNDTWSHGYDTIYEGNWHTYKITWNPYEVSFVFDNKQVWKRTNYHTGEDLRKNDVEMTEIMPGVQYSGRDYFPRHEMQSVIQMHVKKDVGLNELPAAMEVDYVKVSQYFLSPEIKCPDIITDSAKVVINVDGKATNIFWKTDPEGMFEKYEGTGKVANLVVKPGKKGDAIIFYTFQMPSGERFFAETDFLVDRVTSAKQNPKLQDQEAGLKISPNPSDNWFNITSGSNRKWNMRIYSMSMQLIKQADNISEEIYRLNVSGWNPGTYLLVADYGNSMDSARLIVK